MDSEKYGDVPAASLPTAIPVTDAMKQAVAALTGHTGTVLGAVELDSATQQQPVQIVIDIYVDAGGQTHVQVSELWPPFYNVGTVLADIVIGR